MVSSKKVNIRVGYACINVSINKPFRTFRLQAVENKDEEKITEVMWSNMRLFREIVDYNIKHNIYVYRLSSDLIPFCSHPYMKALYKEKILNNEEMQGIFEEIKSLQKGYQLRLSIHPSQFNVLSSPRSEVVTRSIEEINAQTDWIKRVGGQNVVLHMGGAYGDKASAVKRLEANLGYVDTKLLSMENDDKTYHTEDVYRLCERHGLKWVYDFHHHRCHPCEERFLEEMMKSYPPDKYHLSTGTPTPFDRPHADYISKEDYEAFVNFLVQCDIKSADVIFEAKKKNKAIYHILEPLGKGEWQLEQSPH